ncbi:MAG: hypothetical protein FJ272_14405, partial [Planctomycetes bacterium]|nr:hypothetical protein [Planctomycetota bacterium]
MNVTRLALATVAVLAWGGLALGQGQPLGFEGAKWIWFPPGPGESAQAFPASVWYFRAALALPEETQVASAEVIITADNLFVLYLNGQFAGESETDPNLWSRPKRFDVTRLLAPGPNGLAVEAANTAPGPAGLLVKFVAQMADGRQVVLVSDAAWKCSDKEEPGWPELGFDDKGWRAAHEVAEFGARPWGKVAVKPTRDPAGAPTGKVQQAMRRVLERRAFEPAPSGGVVDAPPTPDFPWPDAVVFLGDDCSLYRPLQHTGTRWDSLSVTVFTARKSRAFPEHDLPAPLKVGRKLYALKPARPEVKPEVLLDAGRGAIGSPSVSFDGRWILVSMARDGEPFFHIYRLPAEGGEPQR